MQLGLTAAWELPLGPGVTIGGTNTNGVN